MNATTARRTVGVSGTLITDNLPDGHDVPRTASTAIVAVIFAVVLATGWSVERTRSIHTGTSSLLRGGILALIAFLPATGRDRTAPALAVAEA